MEFIKQNYTVKLNRNGNIIKLFPTLDQYKYNAIMQEGHFGSLVYTANSDKIKIVNRFANKGESYIIPDNFEDFHLTEQQNNRLLLKNSKATLTYNFYDDYFDFILNITEQNNINSFGLALDLNLMDSGKGEDYRRQYIPSFPFEVNNHKFFGFCRPDGQWILFYDYKSSAGWRIVYDRKNPHIFLGFQFLKRFDSRLGGSNCDQNPLNIRVSFHHSFFDLYETIEKIANIKIPSPLTFGGMTDSMTTLPTKEKIKFKEGFFKHNSITYLGYKNLTDLFLRSTDAIKKPYHCNFNLCEGAMWLWALLIRKTLFGDAGKNEYRFKEFFKENICFSKEDITDNDKGKIVSFPHEYDGKQYTPYHLYKNSRIQNAVTMAEIMLEAWHAYKDNQYLTISQECIKNLIRDHLTADGALCCNSCGDSNIDYSTVTACIYGFVDLYRELEILGDKDSILYKEASKKIADHLVKRGLNFPTEGTNGHKEMEEGSISCTALSLLYAYRFVEPNPKYLEFAEELLKLHDSWCMVTPDARLYGSTVRWWETNWEGDADGSSINGGHAWTIWKAEADYHYALIKKDIDRLIRSYNGYITNFAKVRDNGRMYTCFTPDYITSIPFKIKHSYPDSTDGSMPYYVWTRSKETWFITSAIIGDNCLNGKLANSRFESAAISLERLFISNLKQKITIKTDKPIEIIDCDSKTKYIAIPQDGIITI